MIKKSLNKCIKDTPDNYYKLGQIIEAYHDKFNNLYYTNNGFYKTEYFIPLSEHRKKQISKIINYGK